MHSTESEARWKWLLYGFQSSRGHQVCNTWLPLKIFVVVCFSPTLSQFALRKTMFKTQGIRGLHKKFYILEIIYIVKNLTKFFFSHWQPVQDIKKFCIHFFRWCGDALLYAYQSPRLLLGSSMYMYIFLRWSTMTTCYVGNLAKRDECWV